MFERFTRFFLENSKATAALMGGIALAGIISYILLPKQYNPTIIAPAFSLQIPAPGYSAQEGAKFLVRELENRISELPNVDKLYGYAMDNFAAVTVMFKVGTNSDDAKARIHDKLIGSSDALPFGIQKYSIKSIDPEELPQIGFSFFWTGTGLSSNQAQILVRDAALRVRDEIALLPGTSALELIGGQKNSTSIVLDPAKLAELNLSFGEVLAGISAATNQFPAGEVTTSDHSKMALTIAGEARDTANLGGLVITQRGKAQFVLSDIATLARGPVSPSSLAFYADEKGTHPAAFLGIAKTKGTNAIQMTDTILRKVEQLRGELPPGVQVAVIQNEGETARHATNELIFHLFISILVVFGVLAFFLGLRDAINAAACIPLVLALVFIVALIAGFDINRITLFALILSLGILVDDSIVVVENNARHIAEQKRTGLSTHHALLASVREVGPSVAFSTLVRILSFVAMFAVTGMMGDYMGPIPVFSSIALFASLLVAFSVNPFLAAWLHGRGKKNNHHEHNSFSLQKYERLLEYFINPTPQAQARRTRLKKWFWGGMVLITIIPMALGVFNMRMLPKADKNQVWVWVDGEQKSTAEHTTKIAQSVTDFVRNIPKKLPENLAIAQSVSVSVGDALLGDFANLFRGGSQRKQEWQASIRINLSEDRSVSSETYAETIRPLLTAYIANLYPEARLRVLEEPPGPPTMATLHMRIKGKENASQDGLLRFAQALKQSLGTLKNAQHIVDIVDDVSSPVREFFIELDQDALQRHGLSSEQVMAEVGRWGTAVQVGFSRETKAREMNPITVSFDRQARDGLSFLKNVRISDGRGKTIKLDDLAHFVPRFSGREIHTDNRERTINIYAEIAGNSVVYPVLEMYTSLGNILATSGYERTSFGPYGMEFVEKETHQIYRLHWGGEWEITMDTFRDLGLAMAISLLAIYFLIVLQFKSFRVSAIVMSPFLMSIYGIIPGFSLLYILGGVYFTATAMIGVIALGGIVVGNAIIMIDYINQLFEQGQGAEFSITHGSAKRFAPVVLTSIAAVAGSLIIATDPVWSGLAWAITWGLVASAGLTLILVPIFYYDFLKKHRQEETGEIQLKNIEKNFRETNA